MIERTQFDHELETILRLHRKGAGGMRVALALTTRLDRLIRGVYRNIEGPGKTLLSIVALGGYGRKELCFSSDTDIMFLIESDDHKNDASVAVQQLLHRLLDYGLDIGHSFRTIGECLEFSVTDFESWNSLLESRIICGNQSTYKTLRSGIANRVRSYDQSDYVRNLLNAMQIRHRKYGNSTKLLEPNIKNSAGGLRDLHTVLWLMLGTARMQLRLKPKETGLSRLLGGSPLKKQFSTKFLLATRQAFDSLLRIRNEMHLQGRSLHDSLEFIFQRQVAEALRYRSTSTRTSVERFMHEYYIATRSVAQLTRRIANWATEQYLDPPAHAAAHTLEGPFVLKGGTIDLTQRARMLGNGDALRAFLLGIEHDTHFSTRLEDALTRLATRCRPLRSQEETALLREILNKPAGVTQALRTMNDLGLLERWIPEWKGLVAFFQHNIYHYYTADEHTLMVVAAVEGLRDATNSFGDVFRRLYRYDILYLSCLLHDIAKPQRIGDHEIIGVEVAEKVLKRLRYTDALEDVAFLIRNHLLMEQIAFRRNLSDPQTILDFTSRFSNPLQLEYLYLLTYADLSAVNKNVWTEWKGMLLYELYQRSREVLERKQTPRQFEEAESARHREAIEDLVHRLAVSLPEVDARRHLEAFDSPGYLTAFDAKEIAEHIRHIGTGETFSTLFVQKETYTELTIIAPDAPFALSKFCGVLTANDANILDAQIFTRNDGTIIDKFRLTNFVTKVALTESQSAKIGSELSDVLAGKADIQHLLHRHRMKWRRKAGKHNPNIRTDIEFEDHPKFTIIDVYAPDMLGFLYKVTETISRLGLNIFFAKIATRVDGIVDSFYVTDQSGSKIEDPVRREAVKDEILKTIAELSRSELIPE